MVNLNDHLCNKHPMHACLTVHMIKEEYGNQDRKEIYKLTKEHKGESMCTYLMSLESEFS